MMLEMEVGVGGGRGRGSRRRSFFGLVCNRSSGWESVFIISQIIINGVGRSYWHLETVERSGWAIYELVPIFLL